MLTLLLIIKFMSNLSIGQVYQMSQPTRVGIEGYYVKNKYHDPKKIKQEKQLLESVSKGKVKSVSLNNKSKQNKLTFIDDVQKIASKIPAPGQYNTKQGDFDNIKAPSKSAIKHPSRVTIFQNIQNQAKKNNFPSSSTYSIKQTLIDPKHKSSLSKAQGSTFIGNTMVNSINTPGVGQYNSTKDKDVWNNKGITKWSKDKQVKKDKQPSKSMIPDVGKYSPNPVTYNLFQSMSKAKKTDNKNGFGTSRRFSQQKPIVDAAYNILSQWGLKDKKGQDILNKVSKESSKSVYY